METTRKVEIATQTIGTTEKRWVSLELSEDGTIQMLTSDAGAAALAIWGKEDYDFWLTVPREAASLLAFELLRERFTGHAGATDELQAFCKARNIDHEWGSYP